jgi:response regulator RpfG family c-di-GMP phosphodiesterase
MPRLRILYVDDTPLLLDAFRQSLADGPYEVVTAVSILEAQRAAS